VRFLNVANESDSDDTCQFELEIQPNFTPKIPNRTGGERYDSDGVCVVISVLASEALAALQQYTHLQLLKNLDLATSWL
jgi:hypothetical protein